MGFEAVTLDDKYDLAKTGSCHRHAGDRPPDADAEARDRAPGNARPATSPAIAARRSAGSTSSSGAREGPRSRRTSSSSRASTRTSPRPRCGARSRPSCAARAATTACSASGTAKAPASTAPATRFRHANLAGTSPLRRRARADGRRPHLRVLDHARTSREFAFVDAMIPVLNPGGRPGDPRLRPLRLRACRASPAAGSA